MSEHTLELWEVEKQYFGYEVVCYTDAADEPTFIANCGANDDSESRALRIVADRKAALTAPHECGDPQCPGNINRRKLEAYPDLLAACKRADCFGPDDDDCKCGFCGKLIEDRYLGDHDKDCPMFCIRDAIAKAAE